MNSISFLHLARSACQLKYMPHCSKNSDEIFFPSGAGVSLPISAYCKNLDFESLLWRSRIVSDGSQLFNNERPSWFCKSGKVVAITDCRCICWNVEKATTMNNHRQTALRGLNETSSWVCRRWLTDETMSLMEQHRLKVFLQQKHQVNVTLVIESMFYSSDSDSLVFATLMSHACLIGFLSSLLNTRTYETEATLPTT